MTTDGSSKKTSLLLRPFYRAAYATYGLAAAGVAVLASTAALTWMGMPLLETVPLLIIGWLGIGLGYYNHRTGAKHPHE